MRHLSFRRWTAIVSLFLTFVSAAIVAQERSAEDVERQIKQRVSRIDDVAKRSLSRGETNETLSPSRSNAQIAASLIIDLRNNVVLSQLAADRSQNSEVKTFAENLVRDHQSLIGKLLPFSSAAGYEDSGSETSAAPTVPSIPRRKDDRADVGSPETRRETADEAVRNEKIERLRATKGSEKGLDFVRIKREVARRCLHPAYLALEKAAPGKFDRRYIGAEVPNITQIVNSIDVLKEHVSPELSPILADALKTSQAQLAEATRLEESLH